MKRLFLKCKPSGHDNSNSFYVEIIPPLCPYVIWRWSLILRISSLQVISDIMSPLFLAFMFLRTEYYPLSELFGDWFCYFFDYTIAICGFTGQFHSFFLASFRYICLFHDGFMFEYNISPKVNLLFFALYSTPNNMI